MIIHVHTLMLKMVAMLKLKKFTLDVLAFYKKIEPYVDY